MLEAIIYFGAGNFVSAALRSQNKADRILYWDKDCLGWRPITHMTNIDSDNRYLAAYEIEPPVLTAADNSIINHDEGGRSSNG